MKSEELNSDPLRFASLMAHQIQSPLSAVSSALQSVLAEYAGPLLPQQRASLEKAELRCGQAITSVRRMLAIVKAQAGGEAAQAASDLNQVARQVHSLYVSEAAEHSIALTLDLAPDTPRVRPAESALSEMLGALVSNALKYTPDHGRIRVTTAPGRSRGFMRLSVADSGVGVREEIRERIFEPFFTTPALQGSARPGIGLGLAFVKSLVLSAGGAIEVSQADLGGADFSMELPVVEKVDIPDDGRRAARRSTFRVVIIGGVTAGPKAAARIIRMMPEADVTIIERGSILSYAGCALPYYVSGVVRDQKRLISSPAGVVRDPVFFQRVMNVHVMNRTEATAIDRARKQVRVRDAVTRQESDQPYDKLLLATGAAPVVPDNLRSDLAGVFTLHGVKDAEGIKAALGENLARDVVIIGGGLLGIEMTEALVRKGCRVTIIEQRAHILPMLDPDIAALVELHLESHGVRISTLTAARSIEGSGRVTGVATDRGAFPANLVILACGIRPNVNLAADAGLAIGPTGAIRVDARMQTSDPDIYAAGDCVESTHRVTGQPCYIPLGSTASKQGRVAAISLCGGNDAFPGVLGSCICKVFDFTVARTGLGEAEARASGYEVLTALVPGLDRAHFMPAAGLILLKLIVDRASRRILGAQATGPGASDKRIDLAATALAAGMTVDDVANMDLCYAPQFSTDMDNLITAANVARNKLDGLMAGITAGDVHGMIKAGEDFIFLDVRTPEEYEQVRLPKSTPMPLGSLRGRLHELPGDKDIVAFCDISLRAYEAALILRSAGFTRVRVMEGGIAMWPFDKLE